MASGLRSGRLSDQHGDMEENRSPRVRDEPHKGRFQKNQDNHVVSTHQNLMKNLPWPRIPSTNNKTPSPKRGSKKLKADDKQTNIQIPGNSGVNHHLLHPRTPQPQHDPEKALISSSVTSSELLHEHIAHGSGVATYSPRKAASLQESSGAIEQNVPVMLHAGPQVQANKVEIPEQQGVAGADSTLSPLEIVATSSNHVGYTLPANSTTSLTASSTSQNVLIAHIDQQQPSLGCGTSAGQQAASATLSMQASNAGILEKPGVAGVYPTLPPPETTSSASNHGGFTLPANSTTLLTASSTQQGVSATLPIQTSNAGIPEQPGAVGAYPTRPPATAKPSPTAGSWMSSSAPPTALLHEHTTHGFGVATNGLHNTAGLHGSAGAIQQNVPSMLHSEPLMLANSVGISRQPSTANYQFIPPPRGIVPSTSHHTAFALPANSSVSSTASTASQYAPSALIHQQQHPLGCGAPTYDPMGRVNLATSTVAEQQGVPATLSMHASNAGIPEHPGAAAAYPTLPPPGTVSSAFYNVDFATAKPSPSVGSWMSSSVPPNALLQEHVAHGFGEVKYGLHNATGLHGSPVAVQQNVPSMLHSGSLMLSNSTGIPSQPGIANNQFFLPTPGTAPNAFYNMDTAIATSTPSNWLSSSALFHEHAAHGASVAKYGLQNGSSRQAFSGAVQQNMPTMLPSGPQLPIESAPIGGQIGAPSFFSMQYPLAQTSQAMFYESWPSVETGSYDYNWPPSFSSNYPPANNFNTSFGEERRGGRVKQGRGSVRGGGVSTSRGGGRSRAGGFAEYGRGHGGRGSRNGVSGPGREGGRGGRDDNSGLPNRRYSKVNNQVSQGPINRATDPRHFTTASSPNCYGSVPTAVPPTTYTNANCCTHHCGFSCRHHM